MLFSNLSGYSLRRQSRRGRLTNTNLILVVNTNATFVANTNVYLVTNTNYCQVLELLRILKMMTTSTNTNLL